MIDERPTQMESIDRDNSQVTGGVPSLGEQVIDPRRSCGGWRFPQLAGIKISRSAARARTLYLAISSEDLSDPAVAAEAAVEDVGGRSSTQHSWRSPIHGENGDVESVFFTVFLPSFFLISRRLTGHVFTTTRAASVDWGWSGVTSGGPPEPPHP
ncbi:hypothetical protein Sjap_002740 [Stephania japonica]|uniref:Uncharacterized protein n=1 Tax=Stephania japonica TaxID=461633 RepID=A0AAP0PUE6_9MAGN